MCTYTFNPCFVLQGDSGSPLFCKSPSGQWYQEAIVLGGISCGQKSIPGIYTAVGPFRSWIDETISENNS